MPFAFAPRKILFAGEISLTVNILRICTGARATRLDGSIQRKKGVLLTRAGKTTRKDGD
jgi:hypothetical protein